MSADAGNGNQYVYRRLDSIEKQLDRFNEWRSVVDTQRATQAEQMRNQAEAMIAMKESVDGLVRMLLTAVIGVATSALILAVTILFASGKIGT